MNNVLCMRTGWSLLTYQSLVRGASHGKASVEPGQPAWNRWRRDWKLKNADLSFKKSTCVLGRVMG